MKNLHQINITLTAIALMFVLCACSERISQPSVGSQKDNTPPTQSNPTTIANESSGESSANGRLQIDLDNNLRVDAVIVAPHVTEAPVYEVSSFRFNAEKLAGLLLGNGYTSDSSMPAVKGMLYFTNGKFNLAINKEGDDESFYFGARNLKGSIAEMLTYIPAEAPDLSFMTREEAKKTAIKLLADIGLSDVTVSACYTADAAAIKKVSEVYSSKFGGDPAHYSGNPECYIVQLEQMINSIPVWSGDTSIKLIGGTAFEKGLNGRNQKIEVIISADGIYEMRILNSIITTQITEQAQHIITPTDAVNKVLQSYENIINTDKLTIYEIKLVYTILPKSQQNPALVIVPTWACKVIQNSSTNYGRGSSAVEAAIDTIFIDAISGKFLKERY